MRAPRFYVAVMALIAASMPIAVMAAAAESANSPEAMLAAAARASRTTDFEGVLLYRSGNAMGVMQVVHRYKDHEESEHVLTLTGETRELIRQGDHLTCILPSDRRMTLQRPSMKSFLARLNGPVIAQISQWYAFKYLGATRVAGRDCVGVAVEPKDAYRYGYEVWLDRDNHLPLRVILRGENNRVLEQVMFTQIRFPASIPDKAFLPVVPPSPDYKVLTRRLSRDAPPVALQPITVDEHWRFSKLPPGFHVLLHDQRDMPDGVGRVEHMLISDGLSSVSVFAAQEQPSEPSFQGLSHMGSLYAYGRNLDGYHITVVGEAPARTVEMIGNAMVLPVDVSTEDAQVQAQVPPPAPASAASSSRP